MYANKHVGEFFFYIQTEPDWKYFGYKLMNSPNKMRMKPQAHTNRPLQHAVERGKFTPLVPHRQTLSPGGGASFGLGENLLLVLARGPLPRLPEQRRPVPPILQRRGRRRRESREGEKQSGDQDGGEKRREMAAARLIGSRHGREGERGSE